MDPFVVASLGRKTYRTRVIRHNLNPVFDEKMVFQVMQHEQAYSMSFSIVDRDKLSGNDFIGKADFPLSTVISAAPDADPDTSLYPLREPPDASLVPVQSKSRFRLPLSRSSSATSLNKLGRPVLPGRTSSSTGSSQLDLPSYITSAPSDSSSVPAIPTLNEAEVGDESGQTLEDPDLKSYTIPLITKNKEKWEDKPTPQLFIRAKYLPYAALRQQFW